MLAKFKKVIAISFISIFLVTCFAISVYAADNNTQSRASDSWMKDIPDEKSLKDITIPGTHDSGSKDIGTPVQQVKEKVFRPWAITQTRSIRGQLDAGIRLLDIRISYDGGTIMLYHGSGFFACTCNLSLKDAIGAVLQFLADHPTETVIVSLKNEDGSDMSDKYRSMVSTLIDGFKSNDMVYAGKEIPTLGAVRGKMVILNRLNECNFNDFGLVYNDCIIEDHYDKFAEDKKSAIETSLANIENKSNDPNKIAITYTSTNPLTSISLSGFSWYDYLFPVRIAASIATQLTGSEIQNTSTAINSYLINRDMTKAGCYGWFFMDMPSNELINKIYSINFR